MSYENVIEILRRKAPLNDKTRKKIINHKSKPVFFEIRTYGKGELAQLYCPNVTIGAARKKLKVWMNYYPNLMDELRSIGYSDVSRSFTPAQVKLIVDALGEP